MKKPWVRYITRGDTARKAQDRLCYNGAVLDLAGASVVFVMRSIDTGAVLGGAATVLTPVEDNDPNVEYQLTAEDVATVGVYHAEWEITFSDGRQLSLPTKPKYTIHIEEDLNPETE